MPEVAPVITTSLPSSLSSPLCNVHPHLTHVHPRLTPVHPHRQLLPQPEQGKEEGQPVGQGREGGK